MAQVIGGSTGALGTLTRELRPKRTAWQNLANFARRKPLGAFGAVVATILIVVAIFAPLIATHNPTETNSAYVFASPGSSGLLLGGDQLGRDVFSRLVYGARISLEVGILSVVFGVTIGAFIGIVSAYYGGKTDLIVQRFVDAMMAFPALILALAVMAVLGASITNVIIALSVVFIPATARTIRAQALSIKETDYVLAATAVGVGDWRIMLRHMAPNCAATYIVLATLSLGFAIVVEASLSFLGVGVPPSVPSWGGMLTRAAQQYVEVAPWLGVFPGLAIAIVVFAWNLLGDSLRDVLDPRLRGAGS
jgi:ABC-type dipeptide/oligopeptide/nickel transport system permease subunit